MPLYAPASEAQIVAESVDPSKIEFIWKGRNIAAEQKDILGNDVTMYGAASVGSLTPSGSIPRNNLLYLSIGRNSYTTGFNSWGIAGTRPCSFMSPSDIVGSGFKFRFSFSPVTILAGQTAFFGLQNNPNNNYPYDTFQHGIGLASNNVDFSGRLHFYSRGSSITRVDSGISIATDDVFVFEMETLPAGAGVSMTVTKVASGETFTSVLTTNLPAALTSLTPMAFFSNNGVSSGDIVFRYHELQIERKF